MKTAGPQAARQGWSGGGDYTLAGYDYSAASRTPASRLRFMPAAS